MKNTIPQNIIDAFVSAAQAAFSGRLAGVYLHGSAAMGGYNPAVSDLDFIVVVDRPPDDAARRDFMRRVVALDAEAPGKGIEMSVVTRDACAPFAWPTPFELHYSRAHTAWYRRDPEDYLEKMRGTDADLAAHFTVIRARGVCLCGAAIGEVFGEVPEQAYVDSILSDVCDAPRDIDGETMYLTLNLARVLAYLEDRAVLSKREGGAWALERLPEYRPLIEDALSEYEGTAKPAYDVGLARAYARDVLGRIRARLNG